MNNIDINAVQNKMRGYINKLADGENLTYGEAEAAMGYILDGGATQAQISAYLTAIRIKGETTDEISGSAAGMNKKAVHITPDVKDYVDCVGTGGDGTNTFNISTTSAFVIAGAGAATAKHGNRAVSSKCGAADVLEALGVNINVTPEKVKECVEKIGIGFMFARTMHPHMTNVTQVRNELKMRTMFNILGPLSNPSNAKHQLIGSFSPCLTNPMAHSMLKLGIVSGMVVCGIDNNMDEISIIGETQISEIKDGKVIDYNITPEEFGFKRATPEDITGGTAEENKKYTLVVLNGEKSPKRDIVLLNAGAALYVVGKAETFKNGIELAAKSIDSGAALEKLNALIKMTNE